MLTAFNRCVPEVIPFLLSKAFPLLCMLLSLNQNTSDDGWVSCDIPWKPWINSFYLFFLGWSSFISTNLNWAHSGKKWWGLRARWEQWIQQEASRFGIYFKGRILGRDERKWGSCSSPVTRWTMVPWAEMGKARVRTFPNWRNSALGLPTPYTQKCK